jgi:hypothetical protein
MATKFRKKLKTEVPNETNEENDGQKAYISEFTGLFTKKCFSLILNIRTGIIMIWLDLLGESIS